MRVDECRQRADECRRDAAQLVADDVLRGVYLDLARRWRKMAHQAQQKSNTDTAPSSRWRRKRLASSFVSNFAADRQKYL